jgi:energy-converting hydrogenase A subunit M
MINSHKDFKDIKLYYLKNTVTLIKQYFENLSQMNLQKKTVLVKQKPYCLFITGGKN